MRSRSVLRVIVSIILSVACFATIARADLADVRRCVAENTPRLSAVQEIAIDVRKGEQAGFEASLTLFWRRVSDDERRIMLRFREPADLKDAALLVTSVENMKPKVHIYLPEFGRARRAASRGELEGFLGRANLGIAELETLLEPLGLYGGRLLNEPQEVEGRNVSVVEQRASENADSPFPRTRTFIDSEYCVPMRAEYYGQDDALAKVLEVDPKSIRRVESSWVPMELVFRDKVREKDTHIRVEQVEIDVPFSPALLTAKALHSKSR